MRIIYKSRRCGKTTEAAKLANETGAYLACLNRDEVVRIVHQEKIQCDRFPITFEEIEGLKRSWVRNVVIDNFDILLERELHELFSKYRGLKVEGLSFTENPEEIFKRVYGRWTQQAVPNGEGDDEV